METRRQQTPRGGDRAAPRLAAPVPPGAEGRAPLLRAARRSRREGRPGGGSAAPGARRAGSRRLLAALALGAGLLPAACAPGTEVEEPGTGPEASSGASGGYVGREACAPCHAEVAATFAGTGMGRAFYPLDGTTAIEDFTVDNRLEIPAQGLAYEMSASGGTYTMRQIVLAEDGTEMTSVTREMIWVLGSGHHSRSYLTGENGYLYQMPVCWYPGKPGWDLCPGYEHNNLFFMREATGECLFCHNGRTPLAENTTNRYVGAMPHGIGCERCHGPGEEHVRLWKSPPEEMPDRDPTIVNPARLGRERRLQICLQCHLGDSGATERVWRAGRDRRNFRPGEDLDDYLDPITFRQAAENLYGLTAQADRMIRSRCYKESGGALECLTCHDPHVSITAIPDRKTHFRKACLTCHEIEECGESDLHRAGGEGGDCAGCHMRRSQPSDHPHALFTDHWIRRRVDPPGPPVFRRDSLELAPVFPASHAELEPAEALADLGRATRRMKRLNPLGHLIPWEPALEALRRSLEIDPDRAETWYDLGKIASQRGDLGEAVGHLREAVARDPELFDAHEELGTLLLELNRPGEAEAVLRRALEIKGDEVRALIGLGRALVVQGREEEGEAIFRKAAELVPGHSTPRSNLGLLALRQGRPAEAAAHLEEAAAREPSREEIWQALAGALRAAGRGEEASRASGIARRLRGGR